MNTLPSDVHTYISDFLEYNSIILSLKLVNVYFNLLKVRLPKQPHKYKIDYPIVPSTMSSTIRLIIFIDGERKWEYSKAITKYKVMYKTIRDAHFCIPSFFPPNASVWDIKNAEFLDDESDLSFTIFCKMDKRRELAEDFISKFDERFE